MNNAIEITSPVSVYIVHHPDCKLANNLSQKLFRWLRLGEIGDDAAVAGLPVYYRRLVGGTPAEFEPGINWQAADLNVVVVLADHRMILDTDWRSATTSLVQQVESMTQNKDGNILLLPIALHESFYRAAPLYARFNPVRLLNLKGKEAFAVLRRAVTEAIARALRNSASGHEGEKRSRPLDVFLSHAKRDGIGITKQVRDGVREFGQLIAWYDANDLPYGSEWRSPMEEAVERGTASMVATVTDAYPTRPWCRREAHLARTPRQLDNALPVWTVQPVLAVQAPGTLWTRGLPMLEGVPRSGWNASAPKGETARVVDRLVLEMLIVHTHRMVAISLAKRSAIDNACFITWVPDSWTLLALRRALGDAGANIRQILYPGYGLRTVELAEIEPALLAFGAGATLRTFEEVRA